MKSRYLNRFPNTKVSRHYLFTYAHSAAHTVCILCVYFGLSPKERSKAFLKYLCYLHLTGWNDHFNLCLFSALGPVAAALSEAKLGLKGQRVNRKNHVPAHSQKLLSSPESLSITPQNLKNWDQFEKKVLEQLLISIHFGWKSSWNILRSPQKHWKAGVDRTCISHIYILCEDQPWTKGLCTVTEITRLPHTKSHFMTEAENIHMMWTVFLKNGVLLVGIYPSCPPQLPLELDDQSVCPHVSQVVDVEIGKLRNWERPSYPRSNQSL